MLAKINSATLYGIDVINVICEVDQSPSTQRVSVVGLPDATVKESTDRVMSAIRNSNYATMHGKITVNLSPADVRKEGPSFDLPIAIAMLSSVGEINIENLKDFLIMGELALDGEVRPVKGILPFAMHAKGKFKKLLIPKKNVREASVVDGVEIYPVSTLIEAVEVINNPKIKPYESKEDVFSLLTKMSYDVDFGEISGQGPARRAMEIAAAGGHNILLIGSPGSGKTMLSSRLPTILPPLTKEEALEVTKIYSVKGMLTEEIPLITQRKFRSPHHTVSGAGMAGGGTYPSPGEISLAHNGVLFLDEFPEFNREVLEILRQPLEDGVVTISRAMASFSYPAKFMLVAAMNPCPCGYYGDKEKECTCTAMERRKYLRKISGPLLDRIDIHIEMPRLSKDELLEKNDEEKSDKPLGEMSEPIRKRVIAARERQKERFKNSAIHSNAQMNARQLKQFVKIDDKCKAILGNAINNLQLSARAYDKILKLALTIADLENSDVITSNHILEAVTFRTVVKKYWN